MCLQDGTFKYVILIIVIILFHFVFLTPCFPSDVSFNPL